MTQLDDIDDPVVMGYADVCRGDWQANRERQLVVEGEQPVIRLLDAPAVRYGIECIFCEAQRAEQFLIVHGDALLRSDVKCYAASSAVIDHIAGYPFHRGVLAVGKIQKPYEISDLYDARLIVACEKIENEENLGVIIRSAAALGAGGLLVSRKGVSPWSRRSIRVSMGNVFGLPVVQTDDLMGDLVSLKEQRMAVVGAALMAKAIDLVTYEVGEKSHVLLMGNEHAGLSDAALAACDAQVMIPMSPGSDSLNVGVAAGIMMYTLLKVSV
ncbi:TrmH family RNA methyltransferase [Poriferisphaera sp. WC338]|uniref:TrmH family RNA methyltransferase n=1 Tax=Poriferisphaera sp. WC338 TaxID=3425129 RepID=UPI003D8143C1